MRLGISDHTLRKVALKLYRPIPQSFCGGCGLRDLQSATASALARISFEKTGITDIDNLASVVKNNSIVVSGIGCTARMPGFLDASLTWHTTHGRGATIASGIKMSLQGTDEDKTVIAFGGDGDLWAIGANHTMQAAFRDDVAIKIICYDNGIYGMTGGQTSPTTPTDIITATSPLGNIREPLNPVKLLMGINPSFLAQAVVSNHPEHYEQLQEILYQAFAHPGFAYVHVLGLCHTEQGGRNKTPLSHQHREITAGMGINYEEWKNLDETEKSLTHPLGIISKREPRDLTSSAAYQKHQKALEEIKEDVDYEVMSEILLKPYDPYLRENRTAIRLAGIAGWGVIGAGEILMDAAIGAGMNAAALKEYEATQRGGDTAYDVIMSTGEIHSPIVPYVDVLTVLNQSALDKYIKVVSPKGTIFANVSKGYVEDTHGDNRVISSPMSDLLREINPPKENIGLNILSLAICLGYTGTVSREALRETVMQSRVGKKNPALNEAALNKGFGEADRLLKESPHKIPS